MKSDITFLGKIIRVDSSVVEVEVSSEIPSYSPVINGKVYKIGQIGTFVKILAGNIVTYGVVSAVSNTPTKEINLADYHIGSRFLSINLVGEKVGDQPFEKGIGLYPTINDEVHLVTDADLKAIYGEKRAGSISIGKHASSDNLDVYLDVKKLVLRHAAILGSTGSGKSNTVVTVVKRIIHDMLGSRMIIIDPHGEYASAFPEARVFKINDAENPLTIPFWLMNFDELAYFLVGAKSTDDQRPEYRRFHQMIVEAKRSNTDLKAGKINKYYVTADSPIPFSVRKIWYEMNWSVNASYSEAAQDKQTRDNVCLIDEGDAEKLIPASFQPYAMGNAAPHKAKDQSMYAYEAKLRSRLMDSRYDYLFDAGDYRDEKSSKDLHDLLQEWIGSKERLTILDLSNVPFEVLDITVGLITRFVYDSMFWGRNERYTGRNRPLLIVYEEAHTYLGKNNESVYAKEAVERVFKEGRKFGLGAMVVSQRPSELSETILAQVGTFIALRLTNSSDQGIVKSMAPDNMNAMINLLSSLRIGEALIIGEAITIPSRVRLPLQNPRPDSTDPELVKQWSEEFAQNRDDYKTVVNKIREQYF